MRTILKCSNFGRLEGAIPHKDSISKYTEDEKIVHMRDTVRLVTKNWGTQRRVKELIFHSKGLKCHTKKARLC